MLVADTVVVEVKAVERLVPVHEAQLLTYLRLGGWKIGLLVNFNVPVLRDGIVRRVQSPGPVAPQQPQPPARIRDPRPQPHPLTHNQNNPFPYMQRHLLAPATPDLIRPRPAQCYLRVAAENRSRADHHEYVNSNFPRTAHRQPRQRPPLHRARHRRGKARSSQNARVHGLCSRQLHLADAGEAAIFASLHDALSSQLAPAGELELMHFDTIIHARWNLRRCRMNEANLLGSVPDPFLDPAVGAALKTLTIYTSRHERAFHRALKELKALQTERAIRTNLAANAEPSPLIETSRVRRTLLAEIATKAAINKAGFEAAIQQIDKGSPTAPVSYFTFDLAPPSTAALSMPRL